MRDSIVQSTYAEIVQELFLNGECKVDFCGKHLEFEMEWNGCAAYIDGEFADFFYSCVLIRDYLKEISEVCND